MPITAPLDIARRIVAGAELQDGEGDIRTLALAYIAETARQRRPVWTTPPPFIGDSDQRIARLMAGKW
jgi:hypothetical protein